MSQKFIIRCSSMGDKGVLTKNYFIYPETVAEYGAEIERVMTETDRAMEEASEIIAKMASVTERIPSQIRSWELLELCETAQAEIRSFDFLSYGKRVNQGLLNLLDQNQYITDNFIGKMRATTERMREFGAGCRRLTELIDYSGGSLPLKGLALSAVSNVESEGTDDDVSEQEEIDALLEDTSIENFEKLLQIYKNGSYVTYNILDDYMDSLIEEHYLTQSDYESLKGYIFNLRNTNPDMVDINMNHIIELLTGRKEFINSIDDKIAEASDNMSSGNPRAIVEYRLFNEYRDELLDGIITKEELDKVINILKDNNPMTFINIGVLYIHDSGECSRLVSRIIEPYIYVAEHAPAELRNELLEIAVTQNDPMEWLCDRCKLIITIDDVESLDMGENMNQTQKETFVGCWNRLVEMGLSEMHIIAVMANIFFESRCSATNAYNKIYPDLDDYGKYDFKPDDHVAFGILQWYLEARKMALEDYANRTGGDVYELETQLGYFQYEMEDPQGISYSVWPDFLNTTDLEGATEYFCNYIEIAEKSSLQPRKDYAHIIEDWYSDLNN